MRIKTPNLIVLCLLYNFLVALYFLGIHAPFSRGLVTGFALRFVFSLL
jgi:hypothetical protein